MSGLGSLLLWTPVVKKLQPWLSLQNFCHILCTVFPFGGRGLNLGGLWMIMRLNEQTGKPNRES